MPGSWPHLASRFLGVAGARPLKAEERLQASTWLRPEEEESFFAQSTADQRHALESALSVESSLPGRVDLTRAALLHDIGKRHSRLGLIGRSLASLWSKLGGQGRGRWALYLDHGRLGAEELAGSGAEQVVVDFARSHHGSRPASISQADWEVLVGADLGKRPERNGTGAEPR